MGLDDWKQMTPEEESEGEYHCEFCGNPMESQEGYSNGFCSKDCKEAFYSD